MKHFEATITRGKPNSTLIGTHREQSKLCIIPVIISELFGAKSAEFVDPIVDADEVFLSEITLGACFLIVTF